MALILITIKIIFYFTRRKIIKLQIHIKIIINSIFKTFQRQQSTLFKKKKSRGIIKKRSSPVDSCFIVLQESPGEKLIINCTKVQIYRTEYQIYLNYYECINGDSRNQTQLIIKNSLKNNFCILIQFVNRLKYLVIRFRKYYFRSFRFT